MTMTTRSPRTRSLWSKWPATTISALTGLTALALVLATGPVEIDAPAPLEVNTEEEAAAPVEERAPEAELEAAEAKPERVVDSEMEARSAGILGVMAAEKGHFLASPYGGAFAVGSDDADVWGGLTGTEVGEAYGVGGLGLVGTGRGGGGTGEGTIGLGSTGRAGKGGGSGSGYGRGAGDASRSKGSYDAQLRSQVLTVGTVDDNADPAGYRKALKKLKDEGGMALGIDEALWQMAAPKQRHAAAPGGLDVALVIDTTGSMGDELEYLKVELRDIAREVSTSFPGVTQRWGLVVYRDRGDAYVTRSVDFRDIDSFITKLGEQEAGGGGDHPEAMDLAMDASAELSWRTGPGTARMVFLVADAPTHAGEDARRFARAVLDHREAGTAIYPVGASGVASDAEAELRLAAKVTGGQYIFLTDHSGVGGHHEAPRVEQYKVETLHAAMTRMIGGELGDAKAQARTAPLEACDETPTPMPTPLAVDLSALVPVEAPALSPWVQLRERLEGNLLFALGMIVMVLAGMGFDTLIHRWRTR